MDLGAHPVNKKDMVTALEKFPAADCEQHRGDPAPYYR